MPYPVNHTTPELEAWIEAHRDPNWKPTKKRFPRKTTIRRLTDRQRSRITAEWEAEVRYQVSKYGLPSHAPMKHLHIARSLERNGL